MKLTIYMAVFVILFSSCQKDSYTIPGPTQQALNVEIYPTITEPRYAILGDPNSIFSVGERITIYVKYEAANEQISSASLSIVDEMGKEIKWQEMKFTGYQGSAAMTIPQEHPENGYFSATIDLDEQLVGKSLTLRTQVNGSYKIGVDEVPNAFSVIIN